ncbi:MAG TPA: class I SAM-dependent methyltransferase, partial [Prolixibacteraceae bacterium]
MQHFNAQNKLSNLPDDLWLDYLLHEKEIPNRYKRIIPEMPSEKVQLHFTGASGRISLLQSLDFFRLAQGYISKQNTKDQQNIKLLDFGCGWGRITRMWLKSIPGNNIYAVDPMDEMINLCRETIPNVNFIKTNPAPPISIFHENMFDFLTAYSVFSHLNEEFVNLWFAEFARLMKNDGLLFITTRSRNFINHLQSLREKNEYADYATGLRDCFVDAETAFTEYDKGNIIHQPIGGGSLSNSFYGETCIPQSYFSRFNNNFEILGFVPEMAYENNQACV